MTWLTAICALWKVFIGLFMCPLSEENMKPFGMPMQSLIQLL
jgi:hypothetical protein